MQANVDCVSGGITITFDGSSSAEHYTTTVVSDQGEVSHCNASLQPWCVMNSPGCGGDYSASVKSYDGTCFSLPSETVVFREGKRTFVLSSLETSPNCHRIKKNPSLGRLGLALLSLNYISHFMGPDSHQWRLFYIEFYRLSPFEGAHARFMHTPAIHQSWILLSFLYCSLLAPLLSRADSDPGIKGDRGRFPSCLQTSPSFPTHTIVWPGS